MLPIGKQKIRMSSPVLKDTFPSHFRCAQNDDMKIAGWMSILEKTAAELFGKFGRGGLLISVYCDEDDVLIASAEIRNASNTDIRKKPAIWLNKEVIELEYILVVDNAITHPLCQQILPRNRFALGAYVGVPVKTSDGRTIGSVGAYFSAAHRWSEPEIGTMRKMSEKVLAAIEGGADRLS
jgi:GAF domain-containing protein